MHARQEPREVNARRQANNDGDDRRRREANGPVKHAMRYFQSLPPCGGLTFEATALLTEATMTEITEMKEKRNRKRIRSSMLKPEAE